MAKKKSKHNNKYTEMIKNDKAKVKYINIKTQIHIQIKIHRRT